LLTVRVKNRTVIKERSLKLKNTFDMKNKRLNTRKLRYVFYTLLTCVLCVGCGDQPSLVEQIGKDVRSIQSEFEKGYKTQDLDDEFTRAIDNQIRCNDPFAQAVDDNDYVAMRIWCDSIQYYANKADSIYKVMRGGNAR